MSKPAKKHKQHVSRHGKTDTSPLPSQSRFRRRYGLLRVGLVLGLFMVVYICIFDAKMDTNGDNMKYIALGASLLSGKGYSFIYSPPIIKKDRPSFPPVYPAIVGLWGSLFPRDPMLANKVLNGLLLGLAIVLCLWLFRMLNALSDVNFTAAILLVFNVALLRFSTNTMSEISFMVVSLMALYFMIKIDLTKRPLRQKYFWLAVGMSIVGFYTRTAGIALIAGGILYFALRKSARTSLFFALPTLGAVLLWALFSNYLGLSSYIDQLFAVNPCRPELGQASAATLAARLLTNAQRYVTTEIPAVLLNIPGGDYEIKTGFTHWLTGLVLLGILLFGLFTMQRHKLLLASYLGATFGVVLLWPEIWPGTRFIVPVVPLLVFLMVSGMNRLLWFAFKKHTVAISYGLLIVCVIYLLPSIGALNEEAKSGYPPNWNNYFRVAEWISANTAPDAIICCRKPECLYPIARRQAVIYKFTLQADELIQDLCAKKVDYVIVDALGFASTPRYLIPAVVSHKDFFTPVITVPDPYTYLLKFNRKQTEDRKPFHSAHG